MARKIPEDAFAQYVSMGVERSYQALADELGVTKRAVTKLAARENWSERLSKIEKDVREKCDKRLAETLEEMDERHMRLLKAVQGKAVQALKSMPIGSAMEAARAIDMTIKQERLIRGEPTDRAAVTVEETIRREYQNWMVGEDETNDHESEADQQAGSVL